MRGKIYTLDEMNGALPFVRAIVRDIRREYAELPWILVNDTGYTSASGITLDPLTCTIPGNLLVHEMVHFLARFNNECFGVEPYRRCYDNSEHIWIGSSYNILGSTYFSCDDPQRPYLPGTWRAPETERGRIWARVYAGQWPYP